MSKEQQGKWSEKVKDGIDIAAPGGASIVGAFIAESLVGQVLPGATTAVFSYKQKKFEKNLEKFISELELREAELNERLENMEKQLQEEFKEKHMPNVMDFALNEQQEEKIKYLVNGLVNLSKHESITEDFVLTYYDTLQSLRLVDIAILKNKYINDYGIDKKDVREILEQFGISYENYDAIKEKLARAGVFTTQRDEDMDNLYNNVMAMQKFLEELTKGKAKKISRFKNINKRDRYKISKFGRDFIQFFLYDGQENIQNDDISDFI